MRPDSQNILIRIKIIVFPKFFFKNALFFLRLFIILKMSEVIVNFFFMFLDEPWFE